MRFYVLTTRLELSKPWRFFPETPFGGIRQDGLMRGENFSGQKIRLFLAGASQLGKISPNTSPGSAPATNLSSPTTLTVLAEKVSPIAFK